MKQINIKHVASLHTNALNSLSFYDEEIAILKRRLEEIAAKNNSQEASEGIEHFQNEFIIHQEKIDELKHALHENLHQLQTQLLTTTAYAEEEAVEINEQLFEEYLTEEKLMNELRQEFLAFAAKWM